MPLTTIISEGDELQIRVEVTDSLGNVQYFPGEAGATAGGFIDVETLAGFSFYRAADLHVNAVGGFSFYRIVDMHVGSVSAMAFYRSL